MAGVAEQSAPFKRGDKFVRPEFAGLDSNDHWMGECGTPGCHGGHHILKNSIMMLPSESLMNWWDFLDVLECYERAAPCGVCTECGWCQEKFLDLLEDAWGLIQNTWRTVDGQFFMAVKFSPHSERYARCPMTVVPHGRRVQTPEEASLIEDKEAHVLLRLAGKFRNFADYWFKFLKIKDLPSSVWGAHWGVPTKK